MKFWSGQIETFPKPKCFDRLGDLSPQEWEVLATLRMREQLPYLDEEAKASLNQRGFMLGDELTKEGRRYVDWRPSFERLWNDDDGSTYLSCAVIATDGKENNVLLHAFGPAIDWHLNQDGEFSCECVDLHGYPKPGVWVWTGTVGSVPHDTMDGREWDLQSDGEWRAPTDEEWEHIKAGECPWDKENLPKHPKKLSPRLLSPRGARL